MSRISWKSAAIYKWGTRKEKAHYLKLRAGYQEWRVQRQAEYAVYLESPWWKGRRKQKLQQAGYKCEKCGASNIELNVHHRNYKRVGKEKNRDLQVLCRPCHEHVHAKKRAFQRH